MGSARPALSDKASAITREAIAIAGVETLYRLLELDGPDVDSLRPHFARRAKQARQKAATAVALARDLEELWPRIEASLDVEASLWSRISGIRGYRNHLRVEMQRLLACAKATAHRASIEAGRRRATIPRHDDKGATSTIYVGQQLIELVDRLRSHDQARWTMKAIAELIVASRHDWIRAPCPTLARLYAGNPEALSNWIKTRIARERRARRSRARQGTSAR